MNKIIKKYLKLLGSIGIIIILCIGIYTLFIEIKNALFTGEIIEHHGYCRRCTGPRYSTTEYFPSTGFNMTFVGYLSVMGSFFFGFLWLSGYCIKLFSEGKVIIKYLSEGYIVPLLILHILLMTVLLLLGMVIGVIYL